MWEKCACSAFVFRCTTVSYMHKQNKKIEIEEHEATCKVQAKEKEEHRLENLEAKKKNSELSGEQIAKEELDSMTTSIGFVGADCPEKGIRVISLRDGAGSVYSYLCENDVIESIGGKEVDSIEDLKGVLAAHLPGKRINTLCALA